MTEMEARLGQRARALGAALFGVLLGCGLPCGVAGIPVAWAQPQPELTIDPIIDARPGQPVQIVLRALNVGSDASNGSITASFITGDPQVEVVGRSVLPSGPESYTRVFEPGHPMYQYRLPRTVPAQYRTAELYASPWPAGQRHVLQLMIVADGAVAMQARATLRGQGATFFHDSPDGPPDQQGFPSRTESVIARTVLPSIARSLADRALEELSCWPLTLQLVNPRPRCRRSPAEARLARPQTVTSSERT